MLRHLELNSAKMAGACIKEYEDLKVIASHIIKKVFRIDNKPSIILEFKDSFPNIELTEKEYLGLWRKQNKKLAKIA